MATLHLPPESADVIRSNHFAPAAAARKIRERELMLTDARVAAIRAPDAGQDEHMDGGPGYVRGLRLRVGTTGKKTWIVRVRAGAKVINKKLGNYPAMGLGAARKAAEKLLDALGRDGS